MKTIRNASMIFTMAFACAMSTAQERETAPVTLEKISAKVFQIDGGSGANGGVIVGENAVLVIDVKMDKESVMQSIKAIKSVSDKPIKYLVNTHSDGDHIMGNRFYPASITFIAQENCRADFFKENFGRESDWGEPEFYPFTPSITFKEQMNVWLGNDKVELYYFGIGHTTGDLVVYFPEDKIAFIGDQYFSSRPQLIHSNKNGNSFEHVKTLSRMLEILESITKKANDPSRNEALERFKGVMQLEKLSKVIAETSLCGLGQTAPNPVMSTLKWFRHEYEEHIFDRKCSAGVCTELRTFTIDVDKCTGCTVCVKKCPTDAIIGSRKAPHFIVDDKCIACGTCEDVCKFDAITIS